jgi:hypothetical protein
VQFWSSSDPELAGFQLDLPFTPYKVLSQNPISHVPNFGRTWVPRKDQRRPTSPYRKYYEYPALRATERWTGRRMPPQTFG